MILFIYWESNILKPGEKDTVSDKDKNEENRMLAHLYSTYNQEFQIGKIEKYNLGAFIEQLIEGKASDEEGNLFIISREEGKLKYKDTYKKVIVSSLCMNEFEKDIKNINNEAFFYIKAYYDKSILKNMSYHQINVEELQVNFRISILVDESYSREEYINQIGIFLKKIYDREFSDFSINIDFLSTKNKEFIKEYIDLNIKEKTQKEYEDNDFYNYEKHYDEVTIDSFSYDSKINGFENNEEFFETFFMTK